ncbi:MAG: serine hydroxymethyltransferase [Alphaproteobacteria bacterium RIFCSPLOWO2_01_FULL_45_8]|nr:MAG: serine hydroxymethyltransferase [Alphaproteobacteria bacterium RIFCSPLOWO2_01_FULL_45_8]
MKSLSNFLSEAEFPTIEPHSSSDFFTKSLSDIDAEISRSIQGELQRQRDHIELIASENIVSKAVLEAQGSLLTNKYAEGYSGHRYYGGCQYVDIAETLAIERVKKLFNCAFANVQPHSGAQANLAAFVALLNPGDSFLGMSLDAGGHLTHGHPITISGKWFKPFGYGVDRETGLINYDDVERLAVEHKPKLIIAGGSAYSQVIDFARFKEIAQKVGAHLMVDMAHYAGLIAAGVYPSPLPYADVCTSTTHKTLRGPRGGLILTNNPDIAKKINSAVFPGAQGGPLMHIIAAKAVAFKEALDPSFIEYAAQVIKNTQAICSSLLDRGFQIVSGGTVCHLMMVDLRAKKISGVEAEATLDRAGITCNKNSIPFDPAPPKIGSGIRLGAAAITTRGFTESECYSLGGFIADTLESYVATTGQNEKEEQRVREAVRSLCRQHPIY